MSKKLRANTLHKVLAARAKDPLALGPYLGHLATSQQVSATLIAEMVDTQAQTVTRWLFGQSEVQPYWLPKVTMVISLLVWRKMNNALPLAGTVEQQREQIARDVIDLKAAVKSTGRILTRSS